MSRDLEAEIRDRLHASELPSAPEALQVRVRSVTHRAPAGPAALTAVRGRLLVPFAAAIVIAAVVVLAVGTRPPSHDPSPGSHQPNTGSHQPNNPGPGVAALVVESRVGQRCGPLGCALHIELEGPGGSWRALLEGWTVGPDSSSVPGMPVTLPPGSYTLRAEIHVIGDAVYPGEAGPRDLGTTATCSSEFTVTPETRTVVATLGFWLDRCAVGTVAAADLEALAAFDLASTIDGDCGEFGCDYHVSLSGPGGAWQTVVRSQLPASQLAVGPGFPTKLTPGSYRLEASSHLMSDEVEPGSGYQQELGVAGRCSTAFTVALDTGAIKADVAFHDGTCSAGTITTARRAPTADPGPTPNPSQSAEIICDDSMADAEPVLDCATAIDETLKGLGPDRAPIAEMRFVHSCWSPGGGSIGGCAPQMNGVVTVRFVGQSEVRRFGVLFNHGRLRTVEILRPPLAAEPELWCTEIDQPAFTCQAIRDAALAALGPNHPPVDRIHIPNSCPGGQIPWCRRSHLVDVTFAEPHSFEVRMFVRDGADRPIVELRQSDAEAFQGWFGPGYATDAPTGLGPWVWRADLSEDRRVISVEFFGWYPRDGACSQDFEPWIGRDGDDLLVKIVSSAGTTDRPQPIQPSPSPAPSNPFGIDVGGELGGGMIICPLYGDRRLYHVALPEPFLGNTVRDLNGWTVVLD